jgi:hypothetical protein
VLGLLVGCAIALLASAEPAFGAVPGAPSGLSAVRTANGSYGVTLAWKAPSSTGGLPIENYYVDFSSDRGQTWNNDYYTFGTALKDWGVLPGDDRVRVPRSCVHRQWRGTREQHRDPQLIWRDV